MRVKNEWKLHNPHYQKVAKDSLVQHVFMLKITISPHQVALLGTCVPPVYNQLSVSLFTDSR